jgi:hypothetical protein
MNVTEIIKFIDEDLERLKAARALLADPLSKTKAPARKREALSEATKLRMAQAQRKRWAERKKGS